MIERLKNALAALRGVTNITNVVEAPAVELLDMHPSDKLVICFKATLQDDVMVRLRDSFENALSGDRRVIVLGDEIPKFVIARGLKADELGVVADDRRRLRCWSKRPGCRARGHP